MTMIGPFTWFCLVNFSANIVLSWASFIENNLGKRQHDGVDKDLQDYLWGLKTSGKISDQKGFATKNGVGMSNHKYYGVYTRIKRQTDDYDHNDGRLRSKNITANEINSMDIKSRNVIADKILGDKIITDTLIVSKKIRKKTRSKEKRNDHVGSKNNRKKKDPMEKQKKKKKTKDVIKVKEVSLNHITGIEDNTQKEKKNDKALTLKSENVNTIKPHLSPFIHEPNHPLSGLEFIRPQSKFKGKSDIHGVGDESLFKRPREVSFNQFLRKRKNTFKKDYNFILDSLPQLAETIDNASNKTRIENGVTKKLIKPPTDKTTTSLSSSDSGLLRAKTIKSGFISAHNTKAKLIQADSIRSHYIDAKFINMRKKNKNPKPTLKPLLSEFRHSNSMFSVKRVPLIQHEDELSKQRSPTPNSPLNASQSEIAKEHVTGQSFADHDPFASGSRVFRKNVEN